MKYINKGNTLLILLLLLLGIVSGYSQTTYLLVYDDPSDINAQVPDNPFASFEIKKNSLRDMESTIRTNSNLFDSNTLEIKKNITIYIKKGVYLEGSYITWKSSSPNYDLKIKAYPGEKVIFDGVKSTNIKGSELHTSFMKLEPLSSNNSTRIHIEGLIIQNYINGIALGPPDSGLGNIIYSKNNTIVRNVFRNIGSKFDTDSSVGYFGIGVYYSSDNVIDSNIFYGIENKEGSNSDQIHVLYIAHNSSNNIIKNNYMALCSGDAIRVRNACNNNEVDNNYIEQAGLQGFVGEWRNVNTGELRSNGTKVKNNVFTFPYPNTDFGIVAFHPFDRSTTYTESQNDVVSTAPLCESIGAIASGDIDGDGIDEVFVGYNYSNFTKVVRSRSDMEPYLSKPIYFNRYWHTAGMEVNDFNNDNIPELVTAFNELTDNNYSTQFFRGDGITSATNFGMFDNDDYWKTASLTSGDFNNDGVPELITAFNQPDGTGSQIHTGDGVNSTRISMIDTHHWWQVGDMTASDFTNDLSNTPQLITSFNQPDGTGTQIHKGNGTTNAKAGLLYSNNWWQCNSITSGKFGNNNIAQLITSFNSASGTQIFKGNGTTYATNLGQIYSDNSILTKGLVAGDFISDFGIIADEISIGLGNVNKGQLFYGDGISSIKNLGQYYYSDLSSCPSGLKSSYLNQKDNSFNKSFLSQTSYSIYPNPIEASDLFWIVGANEGEKLYVYNMNGNLVNSIIYSSQGISLINISGGIYFIVGSNHNDVLRLIIK